MIQSRRQSSRCLTRQCGTQARSNVREKCFCTQTGRFKSVRVSSKFPRKRLPEIFNRSAYAQHFHEWKKNEGKGEIKPGTYVCTIVVVEEKKNKKKKMEERIVVKLRQKQRSRWNNAMFYASRLTFPRNYASRNNGK